MKAFIILCVVAVALANQETQFLNGQADGLRRNVAFLKASIAQLGEENFGEDTKEKVEKLSSVLEKTQDILKDIEESEKPYIDVNGQSMPRKSRGPTPLQRVALNKKMKALKAEIDSLDALQKK